MFIVLLAAVLSAAACAILMRMEGPPIPEGAPPEAGEDGEEEALAPDERRKKGLVFILCALALNIATGLFRLRYYGAPVLDIVNGLLLCAVLWPCAWVDLREFRIPNRFLIVGVLLRCAVLSAYFLLQPQEAGYVLLRSVVAAAALLLISLLCRLLSPGSIGFGDVKLLMLIGFFLGTDGVWSTMFCSMAAAFLLSICLLVAKKANRKTELPFAPLLLTGVIAASFLTNL